jgi:hypothetical protein
MLHSEKSYRCKTQQSTLLTGICLPRGLLTVVAVLIGEFAVTPSYGQVSRYDNPSTIVDTVKIQLF